MRIVTVFCVALLSTCAPVKRDDSASSRAPVSIGDEFTLALGQTVVIAGKNVSIQFRKVIEDARCPMNARCVWEGNAKIALHIIRYSAVAAGHEVRDSPESTVELNTSERFATRQNVSDFAVELRHLEPTPMAGARTEGYVATLFASQPL